MQPFNRPPLDELPFVAAVRGSGFLGEAVSMLGLNGPAAGEEAIESRFYPHRGVIVRLDVPVADHDGDTVFQVFWKHDEFDLWIYPPGFFEAIGTWLGLQDIVIEQPAFDLRYRITGSDPASIRRLLTPLVTAMVERLAHVAGYRDVGWRIGHGEFRLTRRGRIADPAALLRFLRWSIELYDHTRHFVESEVAGIAVAPTLTLEAARCFVCGETCTGEIVLCSRCQTPHHADCWQYNGRCGLYGCGGNVAQPMSRVTIRPL